MQRERVSENVYWFQSEVYAQVTAGVVVSPQWAVVIDTLPFPDETLEMREFIENDLKVPVRYVINTHYHADHTWGNCFFPGATVISHSLCRHAMLKLSQDALEKAAENNASFKQVKIIFPHLTFDHGQLSLLVGKKNLNLIHTPGHSKDGISVLVEEDRVLFAGDVFLPIPYIVDGNIAESIDSLRKIGEIGLENIIQGHGDVILRGEIEVFIDENIDYLDKIVEHVNIASKQDSPQVYLRSISVEDCGKSRIHLGGLAEELHQRNMVFLYKQIYGNAILQKAGKHI